MKNCVTKNNQVNANQKKINKLNIHKKDMTTHKTHNNNKFTFRIVKKKITQ